MADQRNGYELAATRSFRLLNGWPPAARHSWVVIDVTRDVSEQVFIVWEFRP